MGILSSLWCKAHTLCRKRHNLYHVQICFQILNSFQTNNSHIICILISLTTPWLTSLNQTTTRYLFDMYISCKTRCFTIRDANTNITLPWAYKRITTVVHTSFCVNQIRDTVESLIWGAPNPKLKCFSSPLGVVFAQSIEVWCQVEHEDVVGAAPIHLSDQHFIAY